MGGEREGERERVRVRSYLRWKNYGRHMTVEILPGHILQENLAMYS